ncbi:MAG: hypothetical protein AB7O67_13475 [Vicinamibacterales bacterium]
MQRGLNGWLACGLALGAALVATVSSGQDYKPTLPAAHEAIGYWDTTPREPVSRLIQGIAAGATRFTPVSDASALLPQLLTALDIPLDSQMLVFSKTSFQAARISPDVPRGIYFRDDVAVAFVPGAPSLEVTAVDPVLGSVFYEMRVGPDGAPQVERSPVCLRCHAGPNTAGVPGPYIGSVIPGPTGRPVRGDSAIITDHRTPFEDRWGGWYVTARRGEQPDRANAVASNPVAPEQLVREAQQNLPSLIGRVDLRAYPAMTSDIVALMTFEHQTQATNLLTRVGWEARMLGTDVGAEPRTDARMARDAQMSDGAGPGRSGLEAALTADIEDLVAYLLFEDEAPLVEPIEGTSSFTRTFPERGPRDTQGRSLRDFDLTRRLFRYPLSYMIYSPQFDALPEAAKARVYRRLHDVLTGGDRGSRYAHLTPADRRAILEIVRATKADLPAYWRHDRQ